MIYQAQLFPHVPDLIQGLLILLVALFTIGAGFLCGARRLETAFFAGWGLFCLVFIIIGTLTSIDLAVAIVINALAGLAGLIRKAWTIRPTPDRTFIPTPKPLSFHVLCLGAPIIILVLGMRDVGWDDLAFWDPNLLALCRTHHLPTLLHPNTLSQMAGYPDGLPLIGFTVHLLEGPLSTASAIRLLNVGIVWNVLAMLAAGAALANILADRIRAVGRPVAGIFAWALAGSGLLLEGLANPTFVPKITLTNMGDSATGAGLALIVALLFEMSAEKQLATNRLRIMSEISLTATALVFIRQENLALLGLIAIGFLVSRMAFRISPIRQILPAGVLISLPPLFAWRAWTRYVNSQIPGGQHSLLPFHAWHWSVFGDTLRSAMHVFAMKGGYTALACFLAYLFLRLIYYIVTGRAPHFADAETTRQREVLTIICALTFGNIVFLLFCYLGTSFSLFEAQTAITFWRFIGQTGQSEILALGCILPVNLAWQLHRRTRPLALFTTMVLILPIVLSFTRWSLRYDISNPVPRLEQIALDAESVLPPKKPLNLVDLSGNGFAPLVVTFTMREMAGDRRPISTIAAPGGIGAAEARAIRLTPGTYYWLAEGGVTMPHIFAAVTTAGCSYLFSGAASSPAPLKSWNIGRYRWKTQIYNESIHRRPNC